MFLESRIVVVKRFALVLFDVLWAEIKLEGSCACSRSSVSIDIIESFLLLDL